MTFIEKYQKEYIDLLNPKISGAKRGLVEGLYQRGHGFDLMFHLILKNQQSSYKIVETGTLRNPGAWKDGQSAKLFTEFVECYGGSVRSVDIDPVACATANDNISSSKFTVTCSDSVEFLKQQSDIEEVDLFYLDSYDVKWKNDAPSAEHHLNEFLAIENRLKPGAVVAIDDNSRHLANKTRTGKGRMIVEYLDSKGIVPLYDAYQIIYKF